MNYLKTIGIKTKSFFQKSMKFSVMAALAVCGIGSALAFGPQPANAAVADLFAAADVSGLAALIEAILTTFIVIMLSFIGFKYLKRIGNRA
jgi:branched-subunit amino acid ABC-type transport system permease component